MKRAPPRNMSGNFSPRGSQLLIKVEQQMILLWCPFGFVETWVENVAPPLSALVACACAYLGGDHCPVRTVRLYSSFEAIILGWRPATP